jgi:hypothetical protein
MKASAFAMLDLNKLPSAWALTGIQGKHLERWQGGLRVTLLEENTTIKSVLQMKSCEIHQGCEEGMEVMVTPVVFKKRVSRRAKSQLVQPAERRFTRSCLAEGYKPKPVLSIQPKIKKKSRAKLLIQRADDEEEKKGNDAGEEAKGRAVEDYPVTPVHVLQRVGLSLGIDPSKLTLEQLEAVAKKKTKPEENHD